MPEVITVKSMALGVRVGGERTLTNLSRVTWKFLNDAEGLETPEDDVAIASPGDQLTVVRTNTQARNLKR